MALNDAVDHYTELLRSMISEAITNVAAGQSDHLEMSGNNSPESAGVGDLRNCGTGQLVR